MGTVTIYQFTLYDITTDGTRKSMRWGTREAIARLGGELLEETAVQVDDGVLGEEVPGLTERGFNPHWQTGPQTQVL
jgi:hypothetical protein